MIFKVELSRIMRNDYACKIDLTVLRKKKKLTGQIVIILRSIM